MYLPSIILQLAVNGGLIHQSRKKVAQEIKKCLASFLSIWLKTKCKTMYKCPLLSFGFYTAGRKISPITFYRNPRLQLLIQTLEVVVKVGGFFYLRACLLHPHSPTNTHLSPFSIQRCAWELWLSQVSLFIGWDTAGGSITINEERARTIANGLLLQGKGEESETPAGDSRRRGSWLLSTKSLHRAGRYTMCEFLKKKFYVTFTTTLTVSQNSYLQGML